MIVCAPRHFQSAFCDHYLRSISESAGLDLAIRLSKSFPLNGYGYTSRHCSLNHRVLGGCYTVVELAYGCNIHTDDSGDAVMKHIMYVALPFFPS